MSPSLERARDLLAERVRLSVSARRSLYATLLFLIGTGVWWVIAHFCAPLLWVVNTDASRQAQEALAMKLHGAGVLLGLVALGAMSVQHVRRAWAIGRNRWLGAFVIGVFVVLTATGYALYYLVTDESRETISTLHWIVGLILGPLLILHISFGRRARRLAIRKI